MIMDADLALSIAVKASTTLIAATSPPQASQTSPQHMLYYHGATVTGMGDDPKGDGGECKLLGPFSLIVQAALGGLALLSLVFKRWKERPQRPIKVWAFDVSKQVFGSFMLHLANLLMSMFSAGQLEIRMDYKPNPCSFYLLNLGIDTTLGIPILIVALRILNLIASYTILANPPESIESGNYSNPPSRIMVLFPFIIKVGDWALRWTEGNTALQITFVMLLFPVTMNAIQYYIIDTFIKKPMSRDFFADDDSRGDAVADEDLHREGLLDGIDDAYSSDSEDDSSPGKKSPVPVLHPKASIRESEVLMTEDHSPVPPYHAHSSSSGSSHRNHDGQSKPVA
ncbi:hypothetical protein N7454_007155 [Penicillium verhagenii]|nr:hypothetical protein N7454_007155 [Penicillium verhagenii]